MNDSVCLSCKNLLENGKCSVGLEYGSSEMAYSCTHHKKIKFGDKYSASREMLMASSANSHPK